MPQETVRDLLLSLRRDVGELKAAVADIARLVDPFIAETARLPTSQELTTAMQQRLDAMIPVLQAAVANAVKAIPPPK